MERKGGQVGGRVGPFYSIVVVLGNRRGRSGISPPLFNYLTPHHVGQQSQGDKAGGAPTTTSGIAPLKGADYGFHSYDFYPKRATRRSQYQGDAG